jgi:hypothetical protein
MTKKKAVKETCPCRCHLYSSHVRFCSMCKVADGKHGQEEWWKKHDEEVDKKREATDLRKITKSTGKNPLWDKLDKIDKSQKCCVCRTECISRCPRCHRYLCNKGSCTETHERAEKTA